jgi:hypothetical protein
MLTAGPTKYGFRISSRALSAPPAAGVGRMSGRISIGIDQPSRRWDVRQAAEIFSSIDSLKNRADALYVAVAWIVIVNTISDRPPSQLGLPKISIERLYLSFGLQY